MTFKSLLEDLLFEAKATPEEIYKQYYSDIDPKFFVRMVSADPGTKVEDRKVTKIGRYARVILGIYKKGNLKIEDLPKATEYLTLVYKYAIKFDGNKINTIDDLYEIVKGYIAKTNKSIESILNVLPQESYETILNSNNWYVFKPKTEQASAYLGVNTEWCTTWGKYCLNPDYRDRTNHFDSHNNSGPLFIIINKNDENDKYQLHFESDQLKNPADQELSDRVAFFSDKPEVKKVLFPLLYVDNLSGKDLVDTITKYKDFISEEELRKLKDKYISELGLSGELTGLVSVIVNKNAEGATKLITDENVKSIDITDTSLIIDVKKLGPYADDHDRAISYLHSSRDNAWQYVSEIEYDSWRQEDDRTKEVAGNYLEAYYNENKSELKNQLGYLASDYEVFYSTFIDQIISDDSKFSEKYVDKLTDLTSTNLENAYRDRINENTKYLEIDNGWSDHTIKFPVEYFLQYITEKKIEFITDLDSLIGDYCYEYNLDTSDYVDTPDYDYEYPTNEDMFPVLNDFFEKFAEDLEKNPNCHKDQMRLMEIMAKHFNNNRFENEFVLINIRNKGRFDCDQGIKIEYKNKKTNEIYSGFVSVDRLLEYMNMEPLFERKKLRLSNLL